VEGKRRYSIIMNALFDETGDRTLTTSHGTTLTAITLNSPDPSALARFYERLLGWTTSVDKEGWVVLPNPEGGIGLSFQKEDIYVRPVWPARPGEQQMMMHLEIRVDDLDAGCAHAQACGAILADYQPQDDVRVHLDPDGHPFCLYIDEA
jgi:catechol 2,3-dioxygenase-like lactoylglutathione lyase family enzyme